ncbi:hypothetical protein SBOR_7252 [Sclerotinia borealis F-4128]|uniref:Uncharacterized protein n=1 Tax=Sclerotinia borealis (strain F-4128) TaxID=1432307 RepID=W9C9A2_SCLBF|nr:hypothetical protein SBOR_7252 [Sclerotinia borealis F-4128]
MTSDSQKKGDHLQRKEEYERPIHPESAQTQSSLPATGKIEADVVSRSVAREDSMKSQQLSLGLDTHGCEDGELPAPMRETRQRTQRNERHNNQENSSLSSTIRKSWSSLRFTRSSATSNERPPHQRHVSFSSAEQSSQQPHPNDCAGKSISSAKEQDKVVKLKEEFEKLLENNNKDHVAKERDLQRKIDSSEGVTRTLQAKIEQLETEKQAIEEKHNTFILKQQEVTFRQMADSRWMPVEDSKVVGDLNRLKRDMRSWVKKASENDISVLDSLDEHKLAALMNALSHVVIFEDGHLPRGLSPRKSPVLLLNALLSHSIYKALFQSPFFIFGDNHIGWQYIMSELRVRLEQIYREGRYSNKEDAHIWRSQFLRLLLPPIATETSDDAKRLHDSTQHMIVVAADRVASDFLEGAARYLISNEARESCGDRLKAICREAATISYMLWTRKTTLKITTLHNMGHRPFDPDSKCSVPHSSVDYESHKDQLRGRSISMMVHPLVMVFGTDDGTDYDQGRVWAPAEVWLDSSKPSAE